MPDETISVSRFKATCLAAIARVHRTGKPVVIAKFGKPVAQLTRVPSHLARRRTWLGCMKGTGRVIGDIVAPAYDADQWDALKR